MSNTKSKRLELHEKLLAICPNVYFQSPGTTLMKYPCIVYAREAKNLIFSNDTVYKVDTGYAVTIIGKDPDSELVDTLLYSFSKIKWNSFFAVDGLNHDAFTIYY